MSDVIKVRMTLERETKGTYLYKADKDDAVVTAQYIRKEAFADGVPPRRILLTITERE